MPAQSRSGRASPGALALCLSLCAFGCAPPRGTIGAVLGQRSDGSLVVRETPHGLAAERGGVQVGDEILLIEGRDVRGLRAGAVHQALIGEVGDPVKLTLIREERVVRLTLVRTPAPSGKAGAPRAE